MNAIVINSNGSFEATNSKTNAKSKGVVDVQNKTLKAIDEPKTLEPEAIVEQPKKEAETLSLATIEKANKTAEDRIKKNVLFAELINRYEKAVDKLDELNAFKSMTEGTGLKVSITTNDRSRSFDFYHHATNLEVITLMSERAEKLVKALYQDVLNFDV